MPAKTRGAKGKAKSHVFGTNKAPKKGKDALSKAAAKSKADHKLVGAIEKSGVVEPPKKKARTAAPAAAAPAKKLELMDLPPEIRLMIYDHVVASQNSQHLHIQRGGMDKRGPKARLKPKRGCSKTRYLVQCCKNTAFETTYVARNGYCPHHQAVEWALMWVCSTIRKEVTPLMFEERRIFTIGLDPLLHFLKDLTPDQRASIRHLSVDHCCDQTISLKSQNVWTETFKYIAENLHLKVLWVEARSRGADYYCDIVWHKSNPIYEWVEQICKMRNLNCVNIEISAYEPEIGIEIWEETVDFDSDTEPEYDPNFNWVPVFPLSEDMTWRVAEKVLSRTAWEKLKKNCPQDWEFVRENRLEELERMGERGASNAEMEEFEADIGAP